MVSLCWGRLVTETHNSCPLLLEVLYDKLNLVFANLYWNASIGRQVRTTDRLEVFLVVLLNLHFFGWRSEPSAAFLFEGGVPCILECCHSY